MADIEVSVETEEQFWDGQFTHHFPLSHMRRGYRITSEGKGR